VSKGRSNHTDSFRASLVTLLMIIVLNAIFPASLPINLEQVYAQAGSSSAAVTPSKYWGAFFGTFGDVQIDINRTGIAVRVEIPREFLDGVISSENDTHFIQSNIRNDYYYYSLVDESAHWSYGGAPYNSPWYSGITGYNVTASDGPCFKPRFSLRDPNAPWCVEIWNSLNGTFLPFTPPKFIRFRNLNAPSIAGMYNFTLFVADHTNAIGYPALCENPKLLPPNFCSLPDFVHAWNTTLFVPVSMRDDPATILGAICDPSVIPNTCNAPILGTKAVAYARDSKGSIVARAFVNQTLGNFTLTGLAPGTYQILASAGFDVATHVAYSLTYLKDTNGAPINVTVLAGSRTLIGAMPLDRAPQVCGRIQYVGSSNTPLAHSLSDHPYLPSTGLRVLNITVEALDPRGHTYRNLTVSSDDSEDSFTLLTGSNVAYVGPDPYGTEFAGLPSTTSGPYILPLRVWISGYIQSVTGTVTVSSSPLPGSTTVPCNFVSPNPISMHVGGAISGTLQFWNRQGLETPHQAEASLPLPTITDALFGGNVLIQAYDHSGILRAVSLINGTYPNGTTIYKDKATIPFILFGFNEFLNHTWSGIWNEHDSGLPADQGYSIQVYVRGYELETNTAIALRLGGNETNVGLKMVRGGVFEVKASSYDNRPGSRVIQSALPLRFLNLTIPVRARIYFYDSGGRMIGYVECVLRIGDMVQPDRFCRLGTGQHGSERNSFTVVFAGQNWSLRETWFYGYMPTHITDGKYVIKGYTLGYVWLNGPVNAENSLLGFAQVAVPLLLGNEVDITGPVYANEQLLGTIPENDHATGEALSGASLVGAVPGNLTTGTQTLQFPVLGFGGMVESNGTLEGLGHFFYVGTDGYRNFDYGIDTGTYKAQVPEFGFNRHFMQPGPPAEVTFDDLYWQLGRIENEMAMAIIVSDSLVYGWVDDTSDPPVPLSWVQVIASNGTFQRSVTTLDGQYSGPGALDLPAGRYNITFTVAFYQPQTRSNIQVQWGGGPNPITPATPLCPVSAGTCDPHSNLLSLAQPQGSIPALAATIYACASETLKSRGSFVGKGARKQT
jgi:hypothetical protein